MKPHHSFLFSSAYALVQVAAILLITQYIHAQPSLKGLPIIRTFNTDDYKGGIQNWDITQGASDLLYVANNFGLLVYDGENWKTIPVEEATRILSVAYGKNDFIYLGGQGDFGYLRVDGNGELQYTSLKEKLPSEYQSFNEIWKIHVVGDAAYFATFNHIFKFEKDALEVIDPKAPLGFTFMVRNQLFTHVPSQGLMALEGSSLRKVEGGSAMAGKDLRGMVPFDMSRTLLATHDHGLFLMEGKSVTPWEVPYNNWLKQAQINTIRLLSSNQFAIGTQNHGILLINQQGEVEQLLTEDRGLTDHSVLSLFEDHFGNLWAGLNNGVAFIELGQAFSLINDGMDLSGTGYTAIQENEKVYLGTNNGLFTLKNVSSNNLLYPQYEKIPGAEGQTYSLQTVANDVVLGHHKGAFSIDQQQAFDISKGIQGIWKIEALPTARNQYIAGTYTGMYLLENRGGTWEFIKKYKGFEESSRKFEVSDDATIWMSHGYKGIYKLQFSEDFMELQQVRFYGKDDGFPSNLLINVFNVENRLVFAAEKGVYVYHTASDRFVKDTVLTPFFGEQHIRELEEDITGNLYFLADDEVGMLKKNTLGGYEKEVAAFQRILPFVSDDLENITVIDRENVLFNAKEGFIHYNPVANVVEKKVFATVFRQIHWGDSSLFGGYNPRVLKQHSELAREVQARLPFSKNSMAFHFASAYFEGVDQTKYQYWLENFDEGWSKWSQQTEKEYTNLPAGKYTFRVRSRNSLGDVSEASIYRFNILPPWYANHVAYALYLLLGAASLFIGWVMIDKNHKKQQRNLVVNANKAIQEKETKLKEVASKSEKEITQLKNERLESELQHKNRELASSAMHLITKNEFMQHLKTDISQLLKEEDKQVVNKGLKRVVKAIEKNIAEDEVWEQFEMHFDQVHGDFIKKLRSNYPTLTPQELKLSAFLRMNMSSKEIAQLLNISVRGVEISRYRLRKKLPLKSQDNLIEFMMNID